MTATRDGIAGFVLLMGGFPGLWAGVITSLDFEGTHSIWSYGFSGAVLGLLGFLVEAIRVGRRSPERRFRWAAILHCMGLVGAVIVGVKVSDKQIIFAFGIVLLTILAL